MAFADVFPTSLESSAGGVAESRGPTVTVGILAGFVKLIDFVIII